MHIPSVYAEKIASKQIKKQKKNAEKNIKTVPLEDDSKQLI